MPDKELTVNKAIDATVGTKVRYDILILWM